MNKESRIFVAGHQGLVGSALVRLLRARGYENLLLRSSGQLDLRCQSEVDAFFRDERPQFVLFAAARVGGIVANDTAPADFIRDNLQMQTNVIDSAWRSGVAKFLFLGSSCIYPKFAPQPMAEDALLTGELEPTNQWYAIAKIAGLKMCQAYRRQYGFNAIAAMPTNIYGPGDNFNLTQSHVLPALLRKFHEARADHQDVTLWGTGAARREFLHVDDLADACLFLMDHYEDEGPVNVGCGQDISISELASMIQKITGHQGRIQFDSSKPDGTPRKLLNVQRLTGLGWQASTQLPDGIRATYQWYLENLSRLRD